MGDYIISMDDVIVLSIDYDSCGDILSNVNPPTLIRPRGEWPPVVELSTLTPRKITQSVANKRNEFWRVVDQLTSNRAPDNVMSGSARLLYQRPGSNEQDGVPHMDVLDSAIRERYPGCRLDRNAAKVRDNGKLKYSERSIHVKASREILGKLSIVNEQMRYVRRIFPGKHIRFIFLDDIYAEKLSRVLGQNTVRIQPNTSLHLVPFDSYARVKFRNRRGSEVSDSVYFWD